MQNRPTEMERAQRGRTQAAPRLLFLPDASGAPVPPILRADGTRLRHLIILLNRVSQTATDVAVGEHKLEATACGGAAARRLRHQPASETGACYRLGRGDETPCKEKMIRCGTTHHPEAEIVVTVIWMVVVAVGRARVVLVVVPRTAAHHTPVARRPQIQDIVSGRKYNQFAW